MQSKAISFITGTMHFHLERTGLIRENRCFGLIFGQGSVGDLQKIDLIRV